eukprot:486683_1
MALRVRLNGLISELDDSARQCLQTLSKNPKLRPQAESTLKSFLEHRKLTSNDIDAILLIVQQPDIKTCSNDTPMIDLRRKSDKILLKHQKLKSNSKFRYRKNMGESISVKKPVGKGAYSR